ncbi:uncharacterized protein [Littorina saxatilis]|uniref:uncharacterized protein n=1 Tax=Littorina saxatilis TaxID=31220 RepID=UPI0038B51848
MRPVIWLRDKHKCHAQPIPPLPNQPPFLRLAAPPRPPFSGRKLPAEGVRRNSGSGQKMAADLLNERLPPEWSYAVTSDGRVFFVSEQQCETSWLHPVTGRPVQTGHQAAPGLPNGWEQDFTPEGVTFFIDHKNQQTTFSHPVTGRPVSEENPPLPPSSPPQSPNDRSELNPGTANAKQRSIKAPSAKRNPTAQVVRRGFLYRLESGGISKSWKRRWCVLADFALYIYKNDDEKASLGSVLLPSYRINRCTAQDPVQKEFAFKVEHENTKTVYFHTDTQTDLDSWLGNLQMAATMRGSTGSGFYREANNNNIKPGMGQRSPPYADQRRDNPETSNRSPQGPDPEFHPQWKNPQPNHHTLPGRGAVPPQGGQPTWRSVPDLDRDGRDPSRDPSHDPRVLHRQGEYDPQGSMRSLPREVNQIQGFPSPNLRQDLRKLPQYQSFDPRLVQPGRPSDLDPRGSVRSLQADPRKVPQEFVPLAQSGGRDRGFQPYQRPTDPQQRSSMVSDPGRRGGQGQGSTQQSPQDLHSSQGSFQGSYRPQEAARNGGYMPSHGRSNNDVSPHDTNRNSWRGSKSGPQEFEPHRKGDSPRGYPDSNKGYPDPGGNYPDPNRGHVDSGRVYPDRSPQYPHGGNPGERFSSGSNPRLSTSRDPRASYASSRHSMASQGYVGDRERDNQGSKQNLYPPYHTSRNSLARPEPSSVHPPPHLPSPHNAHAHTYMNVPEMRSAAQQYVTSPGPERPPYPAAVRDQIVRDLADTRSPATAEKLIAAHELNKERMQQSAFFQYPTPPRDGTASRLDESRTSDPAKRLSQYSDRNSLASNSAMRNNDPVNTSNRSQRGSSNDYSDGGRRQDSGSGRFSDSFERRSADERRSENAGMGAPNPGGVPMREEDVPAEMRFGGDPEAKTLRQAYERVQSFRQSSVAARDGMNRRPIQTVREEPDMPEAEVLETKLKKKYPLNGTRLRMSISAGDLIGKTHDELVLLLIQLRRNQAALEKARDFYRESLGKKRPAEREYRRQRNDSVGGLERSLEESHQSFVDIRSQMEEVDKKLEVYRPLINLVDNMVTMGSLYGGDNLMLATQYRKHLLRPDQYQPPRKMLEFSRQHQEDKVIAGIENDVRQLTATEVDLEEKVDRLNQLERLLQEQSFKVASFREDRELLEKALHGITRQMREYQESPRDVRRLQQQQASVEKELSRVTQDLAEASKALEETTVENNKIEHEVSLLRTKVHGELKRSKSAPSLATENANNKQKMERELARVQNMLQGLSQKGEKLSQQMSTIRRSSSGTQLAAAFDEAENARKGGTYLQTDLDSGQQVDLAQQIPGHSPVSPVSPMSPNSDRPIISHQRQETTYGANTSMSEGEGDSRDWDIGDADDNTKRFYGLLPKEKPRGLTVRDVKRQAEQRRERKRDEEDLTFKVSSTDDDSSTFIHARFPSYASSQSSGLDLSARDPNDPSSHLYENLPRSDSMPALHQNGSAPSSRRSSISLMAPKPFTPYQDRTVKPFRSELALNSSEQSRDLGQIGGGGSMFTAGKPFASEMALNSGWESDRLGYQNGGDLTVRGVTHEPLQAGQVGVVSARPLQAGRSVDNIADLQPGVTRATALPTYTRVPQPFRRDPSAVSQSTPHLNALDFSPSPFVPFNGTTRPGGENVSRVYAPRPWAMDRADITPGLYDVKKSPKGRYMTISSSQPSTMEPGSLMNRAMHSSAGDLISNVRVDDVPDVVKSSLNNVDKIDHMDQDMIDREILYFPGRVVIPERYDAEADAEHLTEAEKSERQEKADRIKRLLTNQSVLSMSQPDVNKVPPGQLHNEVLREKKERAHILTLNQELARQVTRASKRAAAERRKTWSGGQFADIKAEYEAARATSPDQFDSPSRVSRHANILL